MTRLSLSLRSWATAFIFLSLPSFAGNESLSVIRELHCHEVLAEPESGSFASRAEERSISSLISRSLAGSVLKDEEVILKMSSLLGLEKKNSLFDPNGVLEFYLGQDGHQYRIAGVSHEEVMKRLFDYFKRSPRNLAIVARPSFLFHGSNSSSLLAFTAYGNYSGELLPLGQMEKKGKIAFTGELIDGRGGINTEKFERSTSLK